MTPHRSGGRGTFILDRKLRIGRLSVASGTNHVPTFRRLDQMLSVLNETGRSDLLRAIRDHELTPLQCYEAFRVNELHRLPTGSDLKPLALTMSAWLAGVDCSVAQKAAHRTAIVKLAIGQSKSLAPNVGDLPAALQEYREMCRKEKHPAQFNRVRASALAFIRDTLKRSHRLYGEVRDVPLMKEKKAPERHILSWTEVQEIAGKLEDPRDRSAFYGMVLTGMGPKEWFIDGWKVTETGVTVYGAKRESRTRMVPAVFPERFSGPRNVGAVGATREKRRFGERLLQLAGVHPYDLRRTYANFLEAAAVPRTRRKSYMGHSGGDVTSLYEAHEVKAFLAEDARRLEAYLAQAPATSHTTKPKLVNA